jgi:hypothetical protein
MTIKILQEPCPLVADYSGTDIPVTIALDEENSILNPELGELQRFCYIVTQVEEPIALSHWVLGICPEITEEDLGEVTVFINGEEQDVVIGENVEIFTPPDTDPGGTCSGLKFDFGLEEQGDVMNVCFELQQTYQVGSNLVCVTAAGNTISTEFVCGPVCGTASCDTTVFQTIDVCVPVTVSAGAEVGPISVICCGEAEVSLVPCPEEGETEVTFYIRRRVCAIIPVEIDVDATDGPATVDLIATSEDECLECPGSDS